MPSVTEIMFNNLNNEQKATFQHLLWLFDPRKEMAGKGRTTLLANVYLFLAIKNPGVWISIQDHHCNSKSCKCSLRCMATCQAIAANFPDLNSLFHYDLIGLRIKVE